jgi:hypothetical protein
MEAYHTIFRSFTMGMGKEKSEGVKSIEFELCLKEAGEDLPCPAEELHCESELASTTRGALRAAQTKQRIPVSMPARWSTARGAAPGEEQAKLGEPCRRKIRATPWEEQGCIRGAAPAGEQRAALEDHGNEKLIIFLLTDGIYG